MTSPVPNARLVPGAPVDIRAGRTISLALHDTPGETTVFLCHGAGGNKNQWRHQWRALTDAGHRVVAWDFPGHGESPRQTEARGYAGAAFVEDYLAVLARYGSAKNVLVAHSYGTRLTLAALMTAEDALRERVTRLVLVGATPPANVAPKGPIVRWPVFLLALMRPWLARGFARLAWDKSADPALIAYEQDATRGNTLFMMQSLMRQIAPLDLDRLGAITQPTRILAGSSDGLTPPAAGAALAKALPNATFETLAATGHQIMLERPEAVTAAILAAL